MAPGFLFNLGMHPRAEQNAEYVVVSAEYELRSGEHEASETPAAEYSCRFTALNTKQPFRAERITPKPVVQGPQTALVVGPGEIHTDNYGRVKVHFYWDRKSQRDDKSSCWIRVSQNWGGKGWGGMFIPHVGQEVIVMFEGGDPDLPLITGRVYNAENMPPVALPGGKTQSVIRDHGGNEIIMEGAAGGQKMRLHSPTHNTTLTLGNSGSVETDSNWMVDAKENYLKKIGGDFKSTVLGNIWDVYFGFFVRAIFGFVNTFIGGWKTEIIRGAEIKNIHGVKSELIKGHVFKGHSGREFTLNKSTDIEKAPSLLWQIKQAKHMHDGYVMRCRSNKNEKIAGDAMQKARAIRNTSDEFYTTARGKVVSKTPELLAKVNKYTAKASKYHVKAAKALMKAKTDIKDGTLTIK
jgi:type VI secretion system secreted protein VgrG